MTTSPASFYRRTEDALADTALRGTLRRVTSVIL